MEKNLDPVIDFRAWELVHHVGDTIGEYIITTFVSKIAVLESYFLSEDGNTTRVFALRLDNMIKYYVTPETYDLIKERMYKGTPIKIEEVVCVERV